MAPVLDEVPRRVFRKGDHTAGTLRVGSAGVFQGVFQRSGKKHADFHRQYASPSPSRITAVPQGREASEGGGKASETGAGGGEDSDGEGGFQSLIFPFPRLLSS